MMMRSIVTTHHVSRGATVGRSRRSGWRTNRGLLSVSSRERERNPPEQVEEKRYFVEYDRIQFGPFDFDPLSLELRRAGRRVRLRPQSARALALLLTGPLAEISREDLRTHLWEDGTYVDYETGLNTCIRRLRHALGDDARRPRFVLTIPGRDPSRVL